VLHTDAPSGRVIDQNKSGIIVCVDLGKYTNAVNPPPSIVRDFCQKPQKDTFPNTPAIYLTHMPHQQVRWRTEGRKGLTIPLEDARERMAMVLGGAFAPMGSFDGVQARPS